MEISQLLASKGASQPASALGQNAKGESDVGDKFAQLYQKAGQNAKSSVETNATREPSSAIVSGGAAGKELLGANGKTSLDKLLDKLDAGIELSDDEASLLDGLADATQMPAEMTPLAQQIAMLAGNDSQVPAGALLSSVQVRQADVAIAQTQGAASGLDAIRQRLELIAQAQRGDATTQQTQGQQPAALMAATQGDQALAPLDKLGDKAASTRLVDSGTLRHQALTAQGQPGALAQANTLSAENMTVAQQNGTFGNLGTPGSFIDAMAGGDGALNGRGGAETLAGQGALAAGAGTTGASSQVTGQAQGITQATLSAPLASAQWQQGLGQQLVSMHQRGNQRVELYLHPADLGPVSISLKMDDQLAQAQFTSANPHVRAAIEQAIPQLREALAENGIQLGEAMVGQQNQQREGDQTGERGDALLADSSAGAGASDDAESLVVTPQSIEMDGRVNLYA
ncbi:flagellar hook-length control protein FliK [Halomonas sp. M20]|uniref:flagellar hook-length control protein FliK n=1 Tax=Halomonas sp. M20 TaxID=2763264 RepID=UPI001D0A78F9|nr:flagellar hook-length control protein FliK [Halomonas sp. M20]